jgi:hypothetical protein
MTASLKFQKGQRFGKLRIIGISNKSKNRQIWWRCKCDCGNITLVTARGLKSGDNKSCGCLRLRTGLSRTHLYRIWRGIIERTQNKKSKDYPRWGGKGVKLYPKWITNYYSFRRYIARLPHCPTEIDDFIDGIKKLSRSIDRIDNSGHYEPGNIRWATPKRQQRNRTDNVKIFYKGKTRVLATVCQKLDLDLRTVRKRINRNWTIQRALNTPTTIGYSTK